MEEQKEIRNIELQWVFVIVGLFFAVIIGLFINGLYDLLEGKSSAWLITLITGTLGLLFLDIFHYLFNHIAEVRKKHKSECDTLKDYFKYRVGTLSFWKRRK